MGNNCTAFLEDYAVVNIVVTPPHLLRDACNQDLELRVVSSPLVATRMMLLLLSSFVTSRC